MNSTTSQRKPYGLFLSIIAGIFLLQSCVSNLIYRKKHSDSEVVPVAVDDNNPFYSAPFQTSAEKVWDLIHTDLSLKVNFDSSSVEGYATLTIKPSFLQSGQLGFGCGKYGNL